MGPGNLNVKTQMESLDIEIEKQKAIAERNRSRRNYTLLGGVLCGVLVSAAWVAVAPDSPPIPKTKILLGVVLGTLAGILIDQMYLERIFLEKARCPVCGYDWEIKEGKSVPLKDQMPTWDECPGCGTLMNDAVRALSRRSTQTAHERDPD